MWPTPGAVVSSFRRFVLPLPACGSARPRGAADDKPHSPERSLDSADALGCLGRSCTQRLKASSVPHASLQDGLGLSYGCPTGFEAHTSCTAQAARPTAHGESAGTAADERGSGRGPFSCWLNGQNSSTGACLQVIRQIAAVRSAKARSLSANYANRNRPTTCSNQPPTYSSLKLPNEAWHTRARHIAAHSTHAFQTPYS